MSNLVTSDEMASLKADLDNAFDTFKREIVVWKEPIRALLSVQDATNPGGFGFGGGDVINQEVFTPQSGIFSVVIRYASNKHVGQTALLENSNTIIPIGEVKIKVGTDCYNYIESGQTDKISFDNRDWYFAGKAQAAPFMGTQYYMYQLKPRL